MTTLSLKNKIIEQIIQIDDKTFLKAIETIIETKVESSTVHLTDFQKQRIEQSRAQIRNGQFTDNDTLNMKVEKWLSEK
jgi:hypothetical protein